MKLLIPLVVLALVGCTGEPLPTYEQLKHYPLDCKKRSDQVYDLKQIQRLKHFGPDPETFDKADSEYYALLKEHLWWFEYKCNE